MPNATPEEINNYLEHIRRTIPKDFIIWHTEKNKKILLELGYNQKMVIEEINNLTVEDYSEGPTPDFNTSNDIWIFGKIIKNREIYIKLKLIGINDKREKKETAYCLSFHIAEKCMNYPYKK